MQLPCYGKVHNHFYKQFWNQTLEVLLHRLSRHLVSTELTNSTVMSWKYSYFYLSHICGLFQKGGVASTSYVLRVRVTSTEHFAETLYWTLQFVWHEPVVLWSAPAEKQECYLHHSQLCQPIPDSRRRMFRPKTRLCNFQSPHWSKKKNFFMRQVKPRSKWHLVKWRTCNCFPCQIGSHVPVRTWPASGLPETDKMHIRGVRSYGLAKIVTMKRAHIGIRTEKYFGECHSPLQEVSPDLCTIEELCQELWKQGKHVIPYHTGARGQICKFSQCFATGELFQQSAANHHSPVCQRCKGLNNQRRSHDDQKITLFEVLPKQNNNLPDSPMFTKTPLLNSFLRCVRHLSHFSMFSNCRYSLS